MYDEQIQPKNYNLPGMKSRCQKLKLKQCSIWKKIMVALGTKSHGSKSHGLNMSWLEIS